MATPRRPEPRMGLPEAVRLDDSAATARRRRCADSGGGYTRVLAAITPMSHLMRALSPLSPTVPAFVYTGRDKNFSTESTKSPLSPLSPPDSGKESKGFLYASMKPGFWWGHSDSGDRLKESDPCPS